MTATSVTDVTQLPRVAGVDAVISTTHARTQEVIAVIDLTANERRTTLFQRAVAAAQPLYKQFGTYKNRVRQSWVRVTLRREEGQDAHDAVVAFLREVLNALSDLLTASSPTTATTPRRPARSNPRRDRRPGYRNNPHQRLAFR